MSDFFSTVAIDFSKINFNWFYENYSSNTGILHTNQSANGDRLQIDGALGTKFDFLTVCGNSLSASATGHLTGGTISEVSVYNVTTLQGWSLYNITAAPSALSFDSVASTLGNSDDFTWLQQQLSGQDLVQLSDFDDVGYGFAGNDTVTGNGGNDKLFGGVGDDDVSGGVGNDSVLGFDGYDSLYGGDGKDTLLGETGDDYLFGGLGDDFLDGGDGNDTMEGGDGNDVYTVDVVADFVQETNANTATGGIDQVNSLLANYTLGANIERGRITATGAANMTGNGLNNILFAGDGDNILNGGLGNDTASYIKATGGVNIDLSLVGPNTQSASGADTLVSIENVSGSNFADLLKGNALANVLDGGAGNDTMIGGDGSDIYVVDSATDVVTETNASLATGGSDTVQSMLSAYTLATNIENGRIMNTGAASMTGNGLNNILVAGAGANSLDGGAGSDTASFLYAGGAVTVNLGTVGAQATGGSGSDTLISIENLTGSNFNDTLTGNSAANVLDGGKGNDTLTGGDGNDMYTIDSTLDIVIETNANSATGGNDTVQSFLSGYTLGNNIENGRVMTSVAGNLTGNALNNALTAGAGNNVLDGAGGDDTVIYNFATAGVTVSLAATGAQATGGSGSDTLLNVENLTGSNFVDHLTGNAVANRLNGGLGSDVLTGGLGADAFIFSTALGTGNIDTITDFSTVDDVILLDNAVMAALGANAVLSASMFAANATGTATSAGVHVIYNTANGHLMYDADGNGAGAAQQIATLGTGLALTAVDILVI